jgi:hypothetical protein
MYSLSFLTSVIEIKDPPQMSVTKGSADDLEMIFFRDNHLTRSVLTSV